MSALQVPSAVLCSEQTGLKTSLLASRQALMPFMTAEAQRQGAQSHNRGMQLCGLLQPSVLRQLKWHDRMPGNLSRACGQAAPVHAGCVSLADGRTHR